MLERFNCRSAFVVLVLFPQFFTWVCTASPAIGAPLPKRETALVPATPFFLFPNNNQAENIKIRTNGQLLVTLNTVPELYQIDPSRNQSGGIVHTFKGYQSLFGIVELRKDIFYVIASNFTGAPDYYGFQGSVSILKVDLRGIPDPTVARSAVRVSKVVDIPQAQLLDGLDIVNKSAGLLISGDAQTGTLYLIDVYGRTARAVLQDAILQGTSNTRAAALEHIGINGVKVYRSNLYFTNTAKGTFGKLLLNSSTGLPVGTPSVLANYGTLTDDLSFNLGNAFISEPLNGILLRPANTTSANNQTRLLTELYGANSNAFGRTAFDYCIIYSTFDGAPSGVARIDVRSEGFCNEKFK